jgi:benzoyl-CoA reductase/2-hydroxyglutaryl-CoA dehydratase subunit BcrC/BadD/HgdB
MMTKEACLQAIQAYRDCIAKEQQTYGAEYARLSNMKDEAPAPDPCTDAFNAMITALMDYEDDLSKELGDLSEIVKREMASRKAAQR